MSVDYDIRVAAIDDLGGARAVMLDALYRDFGTGYVPRWHEDVIDLAGHYLTPARHTLLVAVDEQSVIVATAALDSRGPRQPEWLAERYPRGETAQLRRVYVRPEHRRRGLARSLVTELLEFARADAGYRSVYLHAYRHSPGALDLWRTLGKVVWEDEDGVVHFEIA
ncbi:GNAT family N-acetyltransferase [Lentzea sp. BCCO 10_0856]|uniref:GNAT family N-acetyltransferase n=1 Tax=Lentzea miocenica TaxID=3095431 RepID=A0ABU4T554_9PSEU|nr:GNAT family N-acetyltransferase [Lentzea sp. BCCO 10_0856]MDX8033290.1 GNAT family N-acetyltransferase [Lentzea sp. BCCO 10_0856]